MKRNCPGIFALLAFLVVFPLFLRRKWRVVRRIIIPAPPAEVFPFLNDLKTWLLWTEWARRNGMEFSNGAMTSGVGAVQEWRSHRMSGTIRIVQSVPDDRVVYEFEVQPCECRIEGVIALEAIGGNTRVTWLCKWESSPNPYARYIDLVSKLILKRKLDAGLENLRELVTRRSQA